MFSTNLQESFIILSAPDETCIVTSSVARWPCEPFTSEGLEIIVTVLGVSDCNESKLLVPTACQ